MRRYFFIISLFFHLALVAQSPCSIDKLYISEVYSFGDDNDFIEIHNVGPECSLEGFVLDDTNDFQDFIFNDYAVIPEGGFWLGYEDAASSNFYDASNNYVSSIIGSFTSGLDADGDYVYLSDNNEIIVVEIPIAIEGYSFSYNPNLESCMTNFSPGFENNNCIVFGCMNTYAINYNQDATDDDGSCYVACNDPSALNYDVSAQDDDTLCVYSCQIESLLITEVNAIGEPEDYIEIQNIGSDCSMEGYILDDDMNLNDYFFIENSIIPQGGYWVGYEDSITSHIYDTDGVLLSEIDGSFSSGLGSNGDNIFLSYMGLNTISLEFEASIQGLSYNFDYLGNSCLALPSPGLNNNSCEIFGCTDNLALNFNNSHTYDDGSCLYQSLCEDPLAINYQISVFQNDSICVYLCDFQTTIISEINASGSEGDFIEIHNSTNNFCSIENYMIDDSYTLTDYTFPENSILPPNGYWIGYEDQNQSLVFDSLGNLFLEVEGSFSSGISANGDSIFFSNSSDTLLIIVNEIYSDLSLNFESADTVCYSYPSPGLLNQSCVQYGCMDTLAINYNPLATYEDFSCSFLFGCTDLTAANYDSESQIDNGTCVYSCLASQIEFSEVHNSGINGDYIELTNHSDSSCTMFGWGLDDVGDSLSDYFFSLEVQIPGQGYWLAYEDEGIGFVLDNSGNIIQEIEGGYSSGMSSGGDTLYLASSNDTIIGVVNGTSYGVEFSQSYINGQSCFTYPSPGLSNNNCIVFGCTDSIAINFDINADFEDLSCTYYEGCTDPIAINFDENATLDNGSCVVQCNFDLVYISEVHGSGQLVDGMTDDYIEIYNSGIYDCSMEGYMFDDAIEFNDFTFGSDIIIPSGGFWYAVEDELYGQMYDHNGNFLFQTVGSFGSGISSGGEYIYFSLDDSISMFLVEPSYANYSQSFDIDGVSCYTDPTPGEINESCIVFGCMDSLYLEYNPYAQFDNGTCETPLVFGCMDSLAINYNPHANIEDQTICEFPCNGIEANLTIVTGSWASEISWSITNDNQSAYQNMQTYQNNNYYEIPLCLIEDADYYFNAYDSFGDGWNGATFSVQTEICELVSGTLDIGSSESFEFTAQCYIEENCLPDYWQTTITGTNHTLIIPYNSLIQNSLEQSLSGVYLGVFYENSSGELQCAGSTFFSGSTSQISVMGDDPTTPEIDGLTNEQEFVWLAYDCNTNQELNMIVTYIDGPEVYTTNGLTFVNSITEVPAGPASQMLDLPSGWSMFSTYMIANDMNMASVLSPIIDKVIIAKNNSGAAYLVEWNFNGIGDLLVGQGYQIKTSEAVELEVSGAYVFPEENPIYLTAGWNIIGYLRTEAAAADAVMAVINDTGNLIIAKNYNGAAYLPEFNFNGIGNMVPGQGYQIKVINNDVIEFLSNSESY